MAQGDLFVAACTDDAMVGVVEDVVIVLTRRATTPTSIRLSRHLCREVTRAGRKLTILNVIGPDAGPPSWESSVEIRLMNDELGDGIAGTAIVLEGDGILRSTMRMVARSLMVAMRKNFPRIIVESVEEAAPFIEAKSGVGAERLLALIAGCRACAVTGQCCGKLVASRGPAAVNE